MTISQSDAMQALLALRTYADDAMRRSKPNRDEYDIAKRDREWCDRILREARS